MASTWRRLQRRTGWLSVANDYDLLPASLARRDVKEVRSLWCNPLYVLILLLAVLRVGVAVARHSESSPGIEFPSFINATIDELSEGLSNGHFTSADLVKAYLARIDEINDKLHAVTETNPDALIIAAELDQERSERSIRGYDEGFNMNDQSAEHASPLHGIPILIKDNIATHDDMNNTAGSYALLGAKVPRDATVAKMLRAAGAILLGKASMTEWAYMRSLNMSNGWSARGGQVYNPYFPGGDPEGSSSGSGVGSALGLAAGCLGTETDGSIISPASSNNIVGIKPTVGLTSRHLVIPISEHQDTVGPMAMTVKDAAYILQAIAGPDPYDNYTSAIPDGIVPDYVNACDLAALSGSRIGIPRNVFPLFTNNATGPVLKAFKRALEVMQAAGAVIVKDTNFTAAEKYFNSGLGIQRTVMNADFLTDLSRYLDLLAYNPHNITSLAELRNFTQSSPFEKYPTRDTAKWDSALEQGWNNMSPNFWPTYQRYLYYGNEGGLFGALERHKLDAVVLPTQFASTWAALVGSPIVSVPMGSYPADAPVVKESWGLVTSAPNMPFGISFLGAKFSEGKLIGVAYAFEQRTKVREKIRPYIMPKTRLTDVITKHER